MSTIADNLNAIFSNLPDAEQGHRAASDAISIAAGLLLDDLGPLMEVLSDPDNREVFSTLKVNYPGTLKIDDHRRLSALSALLDALEGVE